MKNTSVDVAVLALLSEVEDVFALKEEQRMALKDFSEGNTFWLYIQMALLRIKLDTVVHRGL